MVRKRKPSKSKSVDSKTMWSSKLAYVSLVSKVSTEFESQFGFGDKVIAEFVVNIGKKCETVDEFDKKLKENGVVVNMPDGFVRTLLTMIHETLPPKLKLCSCSGLGLEEDYDKEG